MKSNAVRTAILCCVSVTWVAACHTHHVNAPPGPPEHPIVCAGIVTTGPSAFDAAPAVLTKAANDTSDRSERNTMLRLEAKLPGFGGWYLTDSEVVVYMKPSAGTPPALVRKTIYDTYASRPEEYVRRLMAPATHAKIIDGNYSLSELTAAEQRSEGFLLNASGLGISIVHNRLVVGFVDSASVCPGVAVLASKGIPADAIEAHVWGKFYLRVNNPAALSVLRLSIVVPAFSGLGAVALSITAKHAIRDLSN